MIVAFLNLDLQLQTDLKSNPHSGQVADIDTLYIGVDKFNLTDSVNMTGIQVKRLPIAVNIVLGSLVQTVIAFILYKFRKRTACCHMHNPPYCCVVSIL